MSSSQLSRDLRVLLIEDNPDDAFLLERHLTRNGFVPHIVRAETADEMSAALDQPVAPDIVLADYNLPTFSGPAALQLLRDRKLDIPFIMLSGAVSEETAVSSMRAGAQDYVTKQNLTRLVPALERELRDAATRRNRIAAEVALRASQDRFHRLVEAMPLGLLIAEPDGLIIYANAAVQRLLGYSSYELASGTVSLHSLSCSLQEAQNSLSPSSVTIDPYETTCITRSGAPIEVLIGLALLSSPTESGGSQVAAFIADLTLQKKSEELLRRTEKLAVAGRLAASVAHEINNPLEAITNCLYLVAQADLSPEHRAFLDTAQQELDRVAKITVQTLRFYRSSTHTAAVDLQEVIESVLSLLDSRIRRMDIQVERRQRPTPALYAYDGEIRQILANFIGNAIDALPHGGRLILRTSTGRHWPSDCPGVVISIADNGTGIDPAVQPHIFEPFFSTKGITGTGLGLWISQEIISRHNGFLTLRSRLHTPERPGGTLFRLFLPFEAAPAATPE